MRAVQTETELNDLLEKLPRLRSQVHKAVVGQEDVLTQLLVSLLAGGHALLEGVPGLAKTLMVRTLAQSLDLSFKRIQFTPDLMPADLIGTEVLEEDRQTGKHVFRFNEGPLFSNIVLADEINRTPPKTQSALLEAMQEHSITYGGITHKLGEPYFILATQNPLEQAGTFPLPEAQLDRFLLYIRMGYPTEADELKVLEKTTGTYHADIEAVLNGEQIQQLQQLVREVPIDPELMQSINQLVRQTRPELSKNEEVKNYVRWGAGTRAGQALVLTAKAHALLQTRLAVTPEDIRLMAPAVLRHRILMNFKAEAEGIEPETIVKSLLKQHL